MIPVCCWKLKPETKKRFFSLLDRQTRQFGVASRVVFSGDENADLPEAVRAVEEMEGIGLLVIGLSDAKEQLITQTFELARCAIRKNRYHFILYVMEDCAHIERMMTLCVHPFSILTAPLDAGLTENVLANVLSEYQELVKPHQDGSCLLVQAGGTHMRLACKDILCIESLEKN
ncbi:MAG: hypothetical protein Q4G52_04565 [Clostridia bacterium]|nr:hypothetical protein [Clostridia bacterium]